MTQHGSKRSWLTPHIPGLSSLAKRGLAGWMIIFGAIVVFSMILMTVVSPWIRPYDPFTPNVGPLLSPPSSQHLFGTTDLGQDMFSRVLSGGGIMIQVAFISVIICLAFGVPIGLFSAYIGGKLDRAVSLVMDSMYAFPGLVLAIAIASVLGRGVVNMALSIAVVYIPSYFRVIRSQVLSIKEIPYTEAARSIGARSGTVISRYIAPNVAPSIITVATMNFADAILTAAGLTFIGLGVEVDVADWGRDLTLGRDLLVVGAWWVILFPGIMIVLLAVGFTLMGEGLGEIYNPKLQERGG